MRHGYTFLNQKVSKRVQYGSILLRFHRQVYDIQGVILNHFVPPKTTVTGNYYATIIKSELLPAIKRKRPHLERSVILLHHHNAPSHSSRIVMDTVNKLGTELLPHPPYSPDLAICDFWLFPNLKNRLLGNKYILLLTHPLPPPKKKKKKKTNKQKKKTIQHTRMTSLTLLLRGCYLLSFKLRPMLPSVGGFAISSAGFFSVFQG